MNCVKIIHYIVISIVIDGVLTRYYGKAKYKELSDHTVVTDSNVFPYIAAILKKSSYISAGALIDDKWVITAADSLFMIRESARTIRVRLGSINYKKGGVLLPIKSFEVHPYFDDHNPQFDIALIMLPQRVRFRPNLYPIRLQRLPREVMFTHFIVNSWPPNMFPKYEDKQLKSMEDIRRRRMLTVSHLHPTNIDNCSEELAGLGIEDKTAVLCLDPTSGSDPCMRDVGAPVVLNGILWGILSSWKPEDCDVDSGSIFVTLVSSPNVSTWIHATVHGHKWNRKGVAHYNKKLVADDYDYNNSV